MWQNIKNSFRRFMTGRHGSDQLSFALLIGGIVLSLLSSITRIMIFYYLGLAAYIWAIFRMFSRNTAKRTAENAKYLEFTRNFRTNVSQSFVRLPNVKQSPYFRCPECTARLRLPRKVGEVTVTCGKCHHQFKQKA
ncbi:MAG: hypothetical protein SPH82_01910 [Eubacteriales bacterium]|nr:hypothetical protein [Eubacteriales bacterium]